MATCGPREIANSDESNDHDKDLGTSERILNVDRFTQKSRSVGQHLHT